MSKRKLFIVEKLLFLGVIFGTLLGFWYFESSYIVKISATVLVIMGFLLSIKKDQVNLPRSRYEILSLSSVYLGVFTLYNLIYSINFPIYIVMVMILILVLMVAFTTLAIDQINATLGIELFYSFVILMGLVVTEVFLSLYFWPINTEIKSLILVVIFYQAMSLVYLYTRSMLRLNKIVGFLIINFLILVIIFWSLWPKLPR